MGRTKDITISGKLWIRIKDIIITILIKKSNKIVKERVKTFKN